MPYRVPTFCLAAIAVAGLSGCEEPDPTACDQMAYSSVNVVLTGEFGEAIPDAAVQYSVNGGELRDCEPANWDDSLVAESAFICGWEEAGDFTIVASAEGYESTETQIVVEADECHVISQSLELQMEPIVCTQEGRYAVQATVEDLSGLGASVFWGLAEEDMDLIPCEDSIDNVYYCGAEASGLIEIWAENDAGEFDSAIIEVSTDECGPITETVDLMLGECG